MLIDCNLFLVSNMVHGHIVTVVTDVLIFCMPMTLILSSEFSST